MTWMKDFEYPKDFAGSDVGAGGEIRTLGEIPHGIHAENIYQNCMALPICDR
jgi:hypothetical protein